MRYLIHLSRLLPVTLFLLLCAVAGAGCGGGEKVVSVSGKVTHNGKPVPGLVVSFVPQNATETGVSTGKTNEDGEYKLTVAKTGRSGAVVGTHKVWVSVPRKPREKDKDQKNAPREAAPQVSAEVAEVLRKYGRLETTPMTVEVTGGEPVDLKLD
jgi:hypothetical protein